ncbi:MAG: hypothetical protein JWN08_497 [Frankiales bacterium]|nr:hypothetical protein [Frankiales bacterium]
MIASTRDSWTIDLDGPAAAPPRARLVELPDAPGEVVCRGLVVQDDAMIELGVADPEHGAHTVYVVAVEHCTHLSPAQARAAAGHLLRAADEAEALDR